KELAIDGHAQITQAIDFIEKCDRIEDHAVADDAFAVRAQHAAGDQLENEFLAVRNHGMARIVASRIAGDGGKAFAENVYNFPLPLIAPLGAQHYRRLRSHRDPRSICWSLFWGKPLLPSAGGCT